MLSVRRNIGARALMCAYVRGNEAALTSLGVQVMSSNWKQPEPTKAYAVYMDAEWYGEGDTIADAWNDARRRADAWFDVNQSQGKNPLFKKIKRYGGARKVVTAAEHEARCVANYVAEGLGEW